jgi:signal transduction histidine kinase
LSVLGRYVVPGVLCFWAVAVSWGTPQAPAKTTVVVVLAAVLTQGTRWPLLCLGGSFAALLGVVSLEPPVPEDALLAMVVYSCFVVGRYARLRHQPWAAAAVLLLLSVNVTAPGDDVVVADVVFPVLFTAAPWLLGLSVQLAGRRERAAVRFAGEVDDQLAAEVRRAATEERLRIAQEFHDVVAHDISGLSLQAQVARRRAEAGDETTVEELRAIERSAQQAMTDLRRLLGVLRPQGENTPLSPHEGIDDVAELVRRASRLGQRVELDIIGTPREVPPALSLAAYRIVQEAVTNARRHGLAGVTRVQVQWYEDRLGLRVRNPVDPRTDGNIAGHGVSGMEERARLFGGSAGVFHDAGQWRVEVELPTPRSVRPVSR